jgi:5-formyltetrahydrofolate cyclo-ligase
MKKLGRRGTLKSKLELRKIVSKRKSILSYSDKEKLDGIVFNKIINDNYYKASRCIFIFVSYNGEVDTHRIIKYALKDKKIVCVPKVISKKEGMISVKIDKFEDLKPGTYGILEPTDTSSTINACNIDMVFVPGAAFSKSCGRVGYGGGFYDRFLKNTNEWCKKIALAYDFQIFDEVPMEKYDVWMDGIITN